MSFEWRDFYQLGERLAAESGEAAQRSAISRAYYAAYGTAAIVLIAQGALSAGSMTHSGVWQAFARADDPNWKRIGDWGFTLKDAREMADYKNPFPGTIDKKVRESLRLAERIIATIEKIQQES